MRHTVLVPNSLFRSRHERYPLLTMQVSGMRCVGQATRTTPVCDRNQARVAEHRDRNGVRTRSGADRCNAAHHRTECRRRLVTGSGSSRRASCSSQRVARMRNGPADVMHVERVSFWSSQRQRAVRALMRLAAFPGASLLNREGSLAERFRLGAWREPCHGRGTPVASERRNARDFIRGAVSGRSLP